MKSAVPLSLAISATLLICADPGNAQAIYVDVTNAVENPQVHLTSPANYYRYPSHDVLGAGFSAGSTSHSTPGIGTYHIADGFLTGFTTQGLWRSSWLDVVHPAPDVPPHGGLGTVDILAPGGIVGDIGPDQARFGHNMPAAPATAGDTNGQYLGIGGDNGGAEYAVWSTALTVTSSTTFQYSYSWIAAGATDFAGNELLPLGVVNMGAVFFLDDDTDYSNGILYSDASTTHTYDGAGNQVWFTEDGTVTLGPGTYYWGFRALDSGLNYIGIEGISIAAVPEPSGALLALGGAASLFLRRRRRVA